MLLALLALAAGGCLGDDEPTADAGVPAADAAGIRPDAGTTLADTGASSADAADPSGDAADPSADTGAPADDAGPSAPDSGTTLDAGSSPLDGGPAAPNGFHGWLTPSVFTAVTGGTISFTGDATGGSGRYSYAWTFNGAPALATGAGPHAVTFTFANGGLARVEVIVTDDTTGDQWRQRVELAVSAVGAPMPPTPRFVNPDTPTVTLEQGGAIDLYGAGTGTDPNTRYPTLFHFGPAGSHGVLAGNVAGTNVHFPFHGSYEPRLTTYGAVAHEAATVGLPVTVTPEQPGSLATGLRIGPLQGVAGCYFCNAYDDNRIAPLLRTDGTRFLAVFDQKTKVVDEGDSILAAAFDGAWQPYTDLDASTGRTVSAITLGEGNPIHSHQFDAAMASNGDAVVVFQQGTNAVPAVRSTVPHIFAHARIGGTWSGVRRLETGVDNANNMSSAPRVVAWRDGSTTRALAAWARRADSGSERIDYAVYDGSTNTWTTDATAVSENPGVSSQTLRLAATPGGRVVMVWQSSGSNNDVRGAIWQGGTWTVSPTPLLTPGGSRDVLVDLAASADGSAIALVGYGDDGVTNPVFALRHSGTEWQPAVQLAALNTLDTVIGAAIGTGFTTDQIVRVRLAVDAAGNALAVWVASADSSGFSGLPAAVSSYYDAATGAWSPYTAWTRLASLMDAELLSGITGNGDSLRLGLDLEGGRGIITYALSPNSQPRGSQSNQLLYKRYDVAAGTWSAAQPVDTHPGHRHGHSQVELRADGSAMVVYEVFPAGTNENIAGAVYARELAP